MPEKIENGRKCESKNSLREFDAKDKCTYTLRIDQSRSKSLKEMFCFTIFESSHDAVFKMCRLEFRFQNLPFSKSTGKKFAVFVCTGGLSVTFLATFKMCRHRENAIKITHHLHSDIRKMLLRVCIGIRIMF